jgi:ribosomal protein S18 acetylase RimI-like enzyme
VSPSIREAASQDLADLMPLVAAMHAEGGLPTDQRSEDAVQTLLADTRNGFVLVAVGDGGTIVGYILIGAGFSVEFAGPDAFVDELYVVPHSRSKGVGTRLLEAAEAACARRGISALHLEVDNDNARALELYQRMGYVDHPRHLMTKWISMPKPAP